MVSYLATMPKHPLFSSSIFSCHRSVRLSWYHCCPCFYYRGHDFKTARHHPSTTKIIHVGCLVMLGGTLLLTIVCTLPLHANMMAIGMMITVLSCC